MVNDVSGGLADPGMARVVADGRLPVGPHALARPLAARMQELADVQRCGQGGPRRAAPAGRRGASRPASTPDRIILDPGLGFAKTGRAQLARSRPTSTSSSRSASRCCSGRAASRTSARCWPARTAAPRRPASGRRPRSRPACWRSQAGVWGVRVHDVRAPSTRSGPGRRPSAARVTDTIRLTGLRARGPPRRVRLRAGPGAGLRGRRRARARPRRRPRPRDDVADTVHYGELADRAGRHRHAASRSTSSRRWPTAWPTPAWPIRGSPPRR